MNDMAQSPDNEIEQLAAGVRTVHITDNRPPVDPECLEMIDKAQVYMESTSAIYDATLNQTNLKNNNNKYYMIQLLEETTRKWYHVWFRWGRVGFKGQNELVNCGTDLVEAKSRFEQKFQEKTKNKWTNREGFQKKADQYDLLKLDYYDNKNLVSLTGDVKAREDRVIEMKNDTQRAPLGILTTDQIKAGTQALQEITNLIDDDRTDEDQFIEACDAFYTKIPHNFGMQDQPPKIETYDQCDAKLALLKAFDDIQVDLTVLKSERINDEHPIDQQ